MKSISKQPEDPQAPVTERQRIEYDRFGPWSYPVTRAEEMPPLFDPWFGELRDASLTLKLPVENERRNLKPGAELYDRLLSVGARGIVYLRSTNGGVASREHGFCEIAALSHSQELLYGQLGLDLVDGSSLVVPFNTVSADQFEDFAALVRGGCAALPSAARFAGTQVEELPSRQDLLFQNILRSLREGEPALRVLACQEACLLAPHREAGRGGLVRLATYLLRWKLDGCFLASTPAELVAVVRGSGKPRLGLSRGYRYARIYLPASSFRGAAVEERSVANGAPYFALRLSAAGHDYEFLFDSDPSRVLAAL